MKVFLVVLGLVSLVLIIFQIIVSRGQKGIEKYPFTLVKEYEVFEVRAYEPTLFTSVKLQTKGYKKSSSQGFSILAGYIFGGNDKNEKIAMTSPVSMSLEDSMTMMFMVPKKFNKETLPKPNQETIDFYEAPAKRMAAISFGGWGNDEKIEKYKGTLKAALDKEGIIYSSKFYFFGYNAPFELLNRRNEVLVELPNS
ncbi:MAG: hypothetical protein ACI9IP_001778 [Arcticibacterium sp.]|jgi:hypothetical protein